jgi:hypothetical protein
LVLTLTLREFAIETNIGDKESSSDLETGAEPHRLELEEEFGKNLVFKKKICEAKRFFSLSPVQRFFRKKKHELTHKASS